MSSNIINQASYLRTQRNFPEQIPLLMEEIDLAYVDIANAVNNRIIGLYPIDKTAINGEAWYIANNRKQQGMRRVYTFSATGAFNHDLGNSLQQVSPRSYGQAYDSATGNWYGVIFGSSVAIAGQYSFFVNATQITVLAGAGAPAITSGFIVLEWLTNV